MLDLPKALNATASDIQDRIQDLMRQKSSEVVQVQDELVKVYGLLLPAQVRPKFYYIIRI